MARMSERSRNCGWPKFVLVLILVFGGTLSTARAGDWCKTNELDVAMRQSRGVSTAGCPPEGACDIPTTRNLYLPDTSQPIIWIRAHVIVVRNTDGSSPAASASDVTASMTQLNTDFLSARIQFQYDWSYFDNTTYRSVTDAEDFSMKCASAYRPDSCLNIWVTGIAQSGTLGYSYLPWSGNALTCTYGCVIEQTAGGGFGGGRHVLTHEVGHALGLQHTFHGVSEVSQCSSCYENPGDAAADMEGDFCADTRPTPTNFNCSDVSGTSPCNGQAWAPTDFLNYMGYASTTCQTHFSPQQKARMRCWTQSNLSPYILGVQVLADSTFGQAPLTVHFTGVASTTATSWHWSFGDGGTADVQNPTHQYGPGFFDVQATIQTASSGSYSSRVPGFVSAFADTMSTPRVGARGSRPVRVDVVTHNYLPLTGVTIPITWAGTFNVVLDSVNNTGTRTYGWPLQVIQTDNANKRRTYGFDFTTGGPQGTLPAGNGPIMSLWFRVASNVPMGSFLPISIAPYAFQIPQLAASAGTYEPAIINGGIVVCRAGDVNNDGAPSDIDDLTYLIAYLYLNGPLPEITAQADCDGVSGIDIGDLTALIGYMYLEGPALTCGT
jgi:hypothetical protein